MLKGGLLVSCLFGSQMMVALFRLMCRSNKIVSICRFAHNSAVLEARLRDITNSKDRLETSIKEKAAENRSIIAKVTSAKPEIKLLFKKCEQLRRLV